MIKVETIKKFDGFGEGERPGEYFYSQNMKKSQFGISNLWTMNKNISTTEVSALTSIVTSFAQAVIGTDDYMFGLDSSGYANPSKSQYGWLTYSFDYISAEQFGGYGFLIGDQKTRLIYSQLRYIGKRDTTNNYTTGTVTVTQTSNAVVGSGTTFDAGMVGKRFRITGEDTFYTVATFTDATHITLSTNYTGSTGSKNYTIYTAYTDKAWDLGSDSYFNKPMDTYEDWIFGLNGNKVFGINTTDDSLNTAAFTMPSRFVGRDIRSGANGILMGFYFNGRSVLILWDGSSDRSSSKWKWLAGDILSIQNYGENWLVTTTRGLYLTDGYTLSLFKDNFLDSTFYGGLSINASLPTAIRVIQNKMFFWGSSGLNRNNSLLYSLDLKTLLYESVSVAEGDIYGVSAGAIGLSYNNGIQKIHLSYKTGVTNKTLIAQLNDSVAANFSYIVKVGQGDDEKTAEAVKLSVSPDLHYILDGAFTFDLFLKVYNFKGQLFNYAQQKVTATTYNQLTINSTTWPNLKRNVGDEVTIIQGVNAGQVRHITAITGRGTATEVWTLDAVLSNYTEASTNLIISPFKLVRKYSFTNLNEVKELYFDIKNKYKGKTFLLKILGENANMPIELQGIQFIYNDLGV